MYNTCKLGKTLSIPERGSLYATGEIVIGEFKLVFKVADVEDIYEYKAEEVEQLEDEKVIE